VLQNPAAQNEKPYKTRSCGERSSIKPGAVGKETVLQIYIAQIYVATYFHKAAGFVWLLSYNSWFYTASYIQLDSVIQIYLATFIQLLVLFGFFPMALGFVWFLAIGF